MKACVNDLFFKAYARALAKDIDAAAIKSNDFEIEWPPKSKKMQRFPEAYKAAWFYPGEANKKINIAQANFIDELLILLKSA